MDCLMAADERHMYIFGGCDVMAGLMIYGPLMLLIKSGLNIQQQETVAKSLWCGHGGMMGQAWITIPGLADDVLLLVAVGMANKGYWYMVGILLVMTGLMTSTFSLLPWMAFED
ncbi:hypothetical protein Q3G72_024569 [Acer saccharum]|nr:hypothetical protein Q3G72_024569 [Acer saccharum]